MAKDKELTLEEALAANKKLEADLENARGVIAELKEALKVAQEQQPASGGSFPQVKLGKDTYDVVIPSFKFKGKAYKAADVVKDEKLASALVKRGSGVLVKK